VGLVRLLAYIVIGYLIYLLVRTLLRKSGKPEETDSDLRQNLNRLEEDPVCGVYISRETAIMKNVDGREVYFCSHNCADKYTSDSPVKD